MTPRAYQWLSLLLAGLVAVGCSTESTEGGPGSGGSGATGNAGGTAGEAGSGNTGQGGGTGGAGGAAHPLVGSWDGSPADCASQSVSDPEVTIKMDFAPTEVQFEQSFSTMGGLCLHQGQGGVTALGDTSFDLVSYHATYTSECNLGMWLTNEGNDHIVFEFRNAEMTSVFLAPEHEECFRLTKLP
jgi:hypothetical protein